MDEKQLQAICFVGFLGKDILILINNSCHPFQLLFLNK